MRGNPPRTVFAVFVGKSDNSYLWEADMPQYPDILEETPTSEEYNKFLQLVGWRTVADEAIRKAFDNSLFTICLRENGELVGLGRVVGDGSITFYIQDIIVVPSRRGRGYSRIIMEKIMEYIEKTASVGAFVGLMSAKNVEGLYKKYGFIERPSGKYLGAGMSKRLEDRDG
jgi:predicted GNAT family N-acyltransferase